MEDEKQFDVARDITNKFAVAILKQLSSLLVQELTSGGNDPMLVHSASIMAPAWVSGFNAAAGSASGRPENEDVSKHLADEVWGLGYRAGKRHREARKGEGGAS